MKYKKCCLPKDQGKPLSQAPLGKQIHLDPRIFISEPYFTCPKCKETEFGVLMIASHSYSRRCRKCWHTARYGLPEIRKKVIYLDQFVISNIAKALDPESRSHERVRENCFWIEAYQKLDRLSKLQLIICPDSSFHHDESLLSGDPSYDALRYLYEHLSNGCTFQDYNTILRRQVSHCFRAYLKNEPDREAEADAHDVVSGNLHEWQDRTRISIDSYPHAGEAEAIRHIREQQYQGLLHVFEQWKTDKTTYNQSFMEEAAAWGRATIETFADYMATYAQIQARYAAEIELTGTYTPLQAEDLLPPAAAKLIFGMLRILEGMDMAEALAKIGAFFRSPHLLKVPYIRLSSMLYASLARKAGAGRVKPPSKGTFTDVNAIASLLPYCDAIFIDVEMAGYLGENPLREEVAKYPVKYFSLRSQGQFLDFLGAVEKEAQPLHLATVSEIYGEDWAQPYMSLITDRRQRD